MSVSEAKVLREEETPGAVGSSTTKSNHKKSYLIAKRALDIVISLIGLVLMLVPMVLIALAIRLESPGCPLYIHHRIGKNGKDLPLLKFRSMYQNADALFEQFTPEQKAEWEENFKLENDPRVTKVGNFLRLSSLDELPQLINVLKGELSLVGPRPVVSREVEKYGTNKEKFLSVTPGLTGYWQAYARSDCSYERRIEMELHYVENANLLWDIQILFATVGAVLRGKGAK